ncbi:General stress protein 18 [Streptomyces sp. YIM 130001]|uniref:type 1 glutamine amidotransferase domain-containing protein n=1 Tax=Streptomyces sp. YIM 130001 TaxID=2259644 RepID=UPI000E65E10D|nr:type 1 glutamine amidotransferase domain-containing protein [Streptomyces sp. YIM 130001]RII20192.1 General stress protein 18 [Streptomyces sp. YIM 130001]
MPDTQPLDGRRILAMVTNYGVEQDELLTPVRHLRNQGAEVSVAAVTKDPIETLVGDQNPGESAEPDLTLAEADPAAYDLLLVPGGTLNADSLRLQDDALRVVRALTEAGKPVAAICHGPWILVEAGLVSGRTLTSYASLRTDIVNAGGDWIDKSVAVDEGDGRLLITSRTPDDLPDFLREIDAALAPAG